jgi:hypothetical protein
MAGLAVSWLADAVAIRRANPHQPQPVVVASGPLARLSGRALACALLGMVSDLDILWGGHRAVTHSLGGTLMVSAGVALLCWRYRWPVVRTTLVCGLAFGSHTLLDWLGRDSSPPEGVMAFWPCGYDYYASGLDLFAEISRGYWKPDEFVWGNLASLSRELLILVPVAAATWLIRARRCRDASAPSQ